MSTERDRISAASARSSHWRRWGPYLSERSWGTVREDYSPNGTAWDYFPFSQSGHRAYRWTEDGLLGICDNHQRLCFSLALWNGCLPGHSVQMGVPSKWGRNRPIKRREKHSRW